MAKKAKKTIQRLIVYPLVAGMLAGGACYLKPKVAKAVELVNILENKSDIISDDRYTKLLNKGASPKDIPHIIEYMESEDIPPFALDSYTLDSYIGLLNKGIPQKIVSQIPRNVLDYILEEIEAKKMPEQLLPYFTDFPEKHSIAAAKHNPIFGTDKEKIRNYIKERLSKAQHLARKNTDYSEDASQIDSIENINMLYLIKGYIDCFQDKDNRKEISKQIKEDLADPYSEHGGVVIFDGKKYRFVKVSSIEENLKELWGNHFYSRKSWVEHIGAVGDYHFHALEEDCSRAAGPSGSVQSGISLNGDIGSVMADAIVLNPYKIDCVITKIKGNKFNADIYFRNIEGELWSLNREFDCRKARVIDLGVFDMAKENGKKS